MTHCKECQYGCEWMEQGKHGGWSCHHPAITKQRGLMYGRYHQREKFAPQWCPEKIIDESTMGRKKRMKRYVFDADIDGQVWQAEAYGDTEEQAREEALWIFKRASKKPISEIQNIRLILPDESAVYGNDCPGGKCEM